MLLVFAIALFQSMVMDLR